MEKRIELERRARKVNQITELNLDNCRSTSIVGLTDEYTALETLSLINVGLTTLKGFPKLPNLKKLELSDNRISSGLNYLTTSPKLQYLNLSGNKIKDLETLKPLEEFKNLAVLDLFNNDVTQVENYRDKIFNMLPSLSFLDGFDCNDEETQSDGDDDDDVNGNDSEEDDERSAFCLNGLEIDLDELEALEQRVKAKKRLQEAPDAAQQPPAVSNEVDELDEYLKELQLREASSTTTTKTVIEPKQPATNFALLLYWLLAILNLANAAYFSGDDDDGEDGDSDESEDEVNGDVSLSEVYNDDLEEDNSDWEEGEGGDDDEEEDSDIDEADGDANESAASVNANEKDADKPADESQARGKKRKHDG
ncbi:Mapmodulin [Drosophila busckii]|uniref:Acidic leucine-rich nuclear phosphoprotein 32 family member A n=1 Tax=Drosophila busckii TaxID=30019 RepID=A0A0M4EW04_DROBS|nr:acidic leucine-rich nuclear phosphoprotein 32 family member A isoform X3 [Drosophila busckii]ALC42162.1 Mapmodulin [Drosophila busckii]